MIHSIFVLYVFQTKSLCFSSSTMTTSIEINEDSTNVVCTFNRYCTVRIEQKEYNELIKDLNGGDTIDLIEYESIMVPLVNCGFTFKDILEAALIVDSKTDIQSVTDYLLSSPSEKTKRYKKIKKNAVENYSNNEETTESKLLCINCIR